MTELVSHLLYCSRNVITTDPAAEIRAILKVSRRRNQRDGITGALLFTSGCFAQVLEGPRDVVERAFERIQADPRHANTTVLEMKLIEEREFGAWSMAYSGEAGSRNPFAALALQQAFAQPQSASGDVLSVMRDLMAREAEWA